MFLVCSFWAGAQHGSANKNPIAGSSKNLVTTYAASGFGLRYQAAGLFSKAGWSVWPKAPLNSVLTVLPQLTVVLDCDRVGGIGNTVATDLSWMTISRKGKNSGPAYAGFKRCGGAKVGKEPDVATNQSAFDNRSVNNRIAAEVTGISGCDLYK